ncbi:1-acyl-sn-glycerol-3-phosphate acyltransferase [Ornithinimicrobium panacihumi]|uniref:1-acyl-sn-glycerol-3-phosphate acyltransferase n=1 Tax=Ornithinimicrobium panacihumi TaxID=2008449 RepID=UPI003F8B5D55
MTQSPAPTPREDGRQAATYWFLKHFVVGPPVNLVFRPWAEGLHHIPEEGGAILASNHLSFSDSVFLPLAVKRRITFPAKKEYFTKPGVKGWLTKQFFLATGQIPIDRSGGSASQDALAKGLEVLRSGGLFGIYPEGTRSPDGRLYRGKTGVARLALEANVPIIPCAMIDTDKAQPTGQTIPNIVRVGVKIGAPMHYPEYAGQENDRRVLRMITDDVMRELQRLSGQEYVDEYAATVKERLAARARAGIQQARQGLDQAREGISEATDRARAGIVDATDRARENIAARLGRDEDPAPEPGARPDAQPDQEPERPAGGTAD